MKRTCSVLAVTLAILMTLCGCTSNEKEDHIMNIYLYIEKQRLSVDLEDNSSTKALVEILKKNDITYSADDYGGFEKVGNLGYTLPTNNQSITTDSGDMILYQGNQICLYYGRNSWNFTRLGRINGYSTDELKQYLGAGKGTITVRISLQ